VLSDVETLMDRRDERGRMHDASANVNTATGAQLMSTFRGIGKKTAEKFIQYREERGLPFAGLGDVRADFSKILSQPDNQVKLRFDGDAFIPAVGVLKVVKVDNLREMLAHLYFVERVQNLAHAPACHQQPPQDPQVSTRRPDPIGVDYRAKPNSRVRNNFSRPSYNKTTGLPMWNLSCWVHVHKRPRCSVARGRKKDATPIQKEMYGAYIKIVDKTNGMWLTRCEVDGSDEMSVPLARKMFSAKAVKLLREVGEEFTANFAEHMRLYFDSCDTRGLTLPTRRAMWERVYTWLMEMEDIFEVGGSYVQGLTRTSWESMLCTLTGFMQLCDYLEEYRPDTYHLFNLRSVNNDPCEGFFSLMGYRSAEGFRRKYNAVKIEADKKFRADRGELRYRLPSQANTGSAALPFNDPNQAGRKRKRDGGLLKKEVQEKRRFIGHSEGTSSRATGVRGLSGAKVNCALLSRHSERVQYNTSTALNGNGQVIFTPLSDEKVRILVEGLADQATIERNTPQGTAAWRASRQVLPGGKPGHRPTGGSALKVRCGFEGLKKMVELWKWELGEGPEPILPEFLEPLFAYGHRYETSAVGTLVDRVLLPLYKSNLRVDECGLIRLTGDLSFLAISPDGLARVGSKRIAIEAKSPAFTQTADLEFRYYYMLQVHAEMVALDAEEVYLISYGPITSSVFHVKFNRELWRKTSEWLIESRNASTFPTTMPVICKEIKSMCQELAKEATAGIRIVQSVQCV
jgi:hypothetical protein